MFLSIVGWCMSYEPLRVSFVMGRATAALARATRVARLRQAAALHLVHETAVVVLPGAQPREGLANSAWLALIIEIDDDVAQRELEHYRHACAGAGRQRSTALRARLLETAARVDGVRQRLKCGRGRPGQASVL